MYSRCLRRRTTLCCWRPLLQSKASEAAKHEPGCQSTMVVRLMGGLQHICCTESENSLISWLLPQPPRGGNGSSDSTTPIYLFFHCWPASPPQKHPKSSEKIRKCQKVSRSTGQLLRGVVKAAMLTLLILSEWMCGVSSWSWSW